MAPLKTWGALKERMKNVPDSAIIAVQIGETTKFLDIAAKMYDGNNVVRHVLLLGENDRSTEERG